MKPETFLVGLRLAGRRALVVGSGAPAEQRAVALLEAGATVRVVSPSPTDALSALAASGAIELLARPFHDADVAECLLVVSTDFDAALGERLHRLSEERLFLFCAVDQPAFGNFSHVAIAKEGDVTLAVSTNGRAPALARRLREELERLLRDSRIAVFTERLADLRARTPSAERPQVLGDAVAGVRIDGALRLPENDDP